MEYGEFPHVLAGLIYAVFCMCFIFSTNEFKSVGLTIEGVFGKFIKDEETDFVLHHIQRMCYTLMVHTILPFGYVLLHMKMTGTGLDVFKLDPAAPWGRIILALYAHASLLLPMSAYIYICYWKRGNFHCHPIRRKLAAFVTQAEPSWHLIAVGVSNEFRRRDKLVLTLGSTGKLVVTQSWVIKISLYDMNFALQADSTLTCVDSETHHISSDGAHNVEYLHIRVGPRRTNAVTEHFSFKINSQDFNRLNDRLSVPITILPNVSFLNKSLIQQFLEVFQSFVPQNPVYIVDWEPELCIGCMSAPAQVKLERHCDGTTPQATGQACGSCQCRPMWCTDCMGKWFALRQDQSAPHTWMSSKCTCPMCRTTFCMLDVCPVMKNSQET